MSDQTMLPPDNEQRELITSALDTSMLVEAAAGTGKTTSMVARMVALLAEDKCRVHQLAAVTFTRKAASQLRARFQSVLEQRVRQESGVKKQRLVKALRRVEQAFMGTIHSFCGRLLRERPVEAGVPLDFSEMTEEEDNRLREEAWEQHLATLYATGAPILHVLADLGIVVSDLKETFIQLAEYRDVDVWPAELLPRPELKECKKKLREYLDQIDFLLEYFPEDTGTDKLMPAYRAINRHSRHVNLNNPADMIALLERFDTSAKPVLKWWPDKDMAKAEGERWKLFREEYVEPTLASWRAYCYEPCLRCIKPALEKYDELRALSGKLNFSDLLMRAAALLRDNEPAIRKYFSERYTHLLVDEFQDTDPIQAEVMLLLTADNPEETDWTRCKPRPGKLFVVGDPKQSIYRFRRADIVTYNAVRDIIEESGGKVISLSANFRTVVPIIEWVNEVFAETFPKERNRYSPAYVALQPGKPSQEAGQISGLIRLDIPEECSNSQEAVEYEAALIARNIRHAIDNELTIGEKPIRPGDVMILTKDKKSLTYYGQALEKYDIEHQVTGGRALGQVPELELLHRCLQAVVEPDNPIPLVGALRSELFGVSDDSLYQFKRAGGLFCYREAMPRPLEPKVAVSIGEVFRRFRQYATWLDEIPPVAAIELIAEDLGLFLRGGVAKGGDRRVGSLAKAIELVRSFQSSTWTAYDLVDYLAQLISGDEAHDGLPARPQSDDVVRVMNLHKSKGLEAPLVFLACPRGRWNAGARIHVDRRQGKVRGYTVISTPLGEFQQRVLAHPPQWLELGEEELNFGIAENHRLQYVAATRAGSALCVTLKSKRKSSNPWQVFAPHLLTTKALPVECELQDYESPEVKVSIGEAEGFRAAVEARSRLVVTPSYRTSAAKDGVVFHVSQPITERPEPDELLPQRARFNREKARHFGTAVHTLLEGAFSQPKLTLEQMAQADSLLGSCDDEEFVKSVIKTARNTFESDFCQRVRKSDRVLVEVPFEMVDPRDEEPSEEMAILRGVIDLVFYEKGGWIIVDWKTDAVEPGNEDVILQRYAPQLDAYRRAWHKITKEPIAEVGLYLTSVQRYFGQRVRIF